MGNRKIFSRYPTTPELLDCIRFYNVFRENPEEMTKPDIFKETNAKFHYVYLKLMLAERNIRYTKEYPRDTAEPYYLVQLQERIEQTPQHLNSFQTFLDFCSQVNQQLQSTN